MIKIPDNVDSELRRKGYAFVKNTPLCNDTERMSASVYRKEGQNNVYVVDIKANGIYVPIPISAKSVDDLLIRIGMIQNTIKNSTQNSAQQLVSIQESYLEDIL